MNKNKTITFKQKVRSGKESTKKDFAMLKRFVKKLILWQYFFKNIS